MVQGIAWIYVLTASVIEEIWLFRFISVIAFSLHEFCVLYNMAISSPSPLLSHKILFLSHFNLLQDDAPKVMNGNGMPDT